MSRKLKLKELERQASRELNRALKKINRGAKLIRDHLGLKVVYNGLACVCRGTGSKRPYSVMCHLDEDLNAIYCDENITIVRRRLGCDRNRDYCLAYVKIIVKKSKAENVVDRYFISKKLSKKRVHHGSRSTRRSR